MEKIFSTRVLHDGWEMDNEIWVIQNANGENEVRTTNHGGECIACKSEIEASIEETRSSLEGLMKILAYFK